MKNPTSGDLGIMFNAINAAQKPHNVIYDGWATQTSGNPHAHAILRGYSKNGIMIPNYRDQDLSHAAQEYRKTDLHNPAIIVDASHANSNKDHTKQIDVVQSVLG
jgi:3-deoxy-7-phosphoheptulonate synthase